jgi:predicted Zn-dependent peptidase
VTHENFENQRAVVKEERRQRYDNRPYGTVWENIADKLWPTSGYHWTTIGSMDHLDQATVQDAQAFHAEFYKPNNCSLALAGDFEEAEARRLIDRYFAPIPKGTPVTRAPQNVTQTPGEVRFTLEDAVKLPAVYIAFQGGSTLSREEYILDLLAGALATGHSSRLYSELIYRRKMARDVNAMNWGLEKTGVFHIEAKVRPERSLEEVEDALWNEIEKVRAQPLGAMELEKIKNRAEMNVIASLAELGSRADRLQQGWCYKGNSSQCMEEVGIYRSISAEEIQSLAIRHLDSSHCLVGHVVPK